MKVEWSSLAYARLLEIESYVEQDSPSAAVALVDRLVERAEGLAKYPSRGRVVPELPASGFREVFEGNYRLIYRVRDGVVQIITVFEGHRLLRSDELA